jgi:PAS domain S-box-containing protein
MDREKMDETIAAIVKEIGIDAGEVARRKNYLKLEERDLALLRGFHERQEGASVLVDAFYEHLLSFEETRALLPDDATLERLKETLRSYFDSLTAGDYGCAYVQNRLRIGMVHQRIGLEPKWYLGAYAQYLLRLLPKVWQLSGESAGAFIETYGAVLKIVFLDMGLAIDAYRQVDRQAILTAKDQLQNVISSVPLGMLLLSGDLHILSANLAFREMLGDPKAEFRGKSLLEVLPPSDLAEWATQVLGGSVHQYQAMIDIKTVNGERRLEMITMRGVRYTEGDRARLLVIVEDITERKRAEDALRQSEERFRSMIENILDIITVLSPDGTIRYESPSIERVLGYRPEEMIGKNAFELVHPDDLSSAMKIFSEGLRTPGATRSVVFRFRHRDGSWRILEAIGKNVMNDPVMAGIIINSRDITERKQAEEKLQKAYRELQDAQAHILQSEKMASLGQMAAGVAHEINNPVGFVGSNLRTLEEYMADLLQLVGGYESLLAAVERGDPEAMEGEKRRVRALSKQVDVGFLMEDLSRLVQQSLDGMDRVRQIVQDLKEFSHVDRAERMRFNINQGIESTLNIVWNELKYKAELIKELGDIPEIYCYPQQLNQVFMNLLVNAAQAMPQKGKIWIRSYLTGDRIVVEIEDSGCGIPEENLKKIFDPFFTTKPVGKGTGLGLSVSYGIVQKHHGRIEVESAVGKGTKFRVLLPIEEPGSEG